MIEFLVGLAAVAIFIGIDYAGFWLYNKFIEKRGNYEPFLFVIEAGTIIFALAFVAASLVGVIMGIWFIGDLILKSI